MSAHANTNAEATVVPKFNQGPIRQRGVSVGGVFLVTFWSKCLHPDRSVGAKSDKETASAAQQFVLSSASFRVHLPDGRQVRVISGFICIFCVPPCPSVAKYSCVFVQFVAQKSPEQIRGSQTSGFTSSSQKPSSSKMIHSHSLLHQSQPAQSSCKDHLSECLQKES